MSNRLKDKLIRYKLIIAHQDLVRCNQFEEARLILQLLRNGEVKLGLDQVSLFVEMICEAQGCYVHHQSSGFGSIVYLRHL